MICVYMYVCLESVCAKNSIIKILHDFLIRIPVYEALFHLPSSSLLPFVNEKKKSRRENDENSFMYFIRSLYVLSCHSFMWKIRSRIFSHNIFGFWRLSMSIENKNRISIEIRFKQIPMRTTNTFGHESVFHSFG